LRARTESTNPRLADDTSRRDETVMSSASHETLDAIASRALERV
jgi:hypothetical protein